MSLTFLEKIAPYPQPWTFILLAAAWLCLIASVLLELYALSTSQTVANEQIEALTEEYRQYLISLPGHPPVAEAIRPPQSQAVIERWKDRTRLFNRISLWLLTAGVALLCAFSLFNLPYSRSGDTGMSNGKKASPPKPVNESKGSYVPPGNVLRPPPPPKPPAPVPSAPKK